MFAINGDKKKAIATVTEIDPLLGEAVIMHNDVVQLSDVHVSESIGQIYELEASLHSLINEFKSVGLEKATRSKLQGICSLGAGLRSAES